MNAERPEAKSPGTIIPFVCILLVAADLLYFADFLLGSRLDSWMGLGLSGWIATLPGYGLYVLLLLVIAAPLTALAHRILPGGLSRILTATCCTVIAMVILTLLARRLGFIRLEPHIYRYGFSAAGALFAIGALGSINRSIIWVALSALIAIDAGLILLQVFALTLFTFDTGYATAHLYVAGWAGAVTLLGAVFYAFGSPSGVQKTLGLFGIAVIAFAAPGIVMATAAKGESSDRADAKNVILITADTMRADYGSLYGGSVPTPNLDRLAAKGTWLNQYYAIAPWTVPSFSGLFSSKYAPSVTLNKTYNERMEELSYYRDMESYWQGDAKRSLVNDLSNSGYTTYAFVGNFALYGHDWLLNDFDKSTVMPFLASVWQGPLTSLPLLSAALRQVNPDAYEVRPFDYTRAVTDYTHAFLRFRTEGNFFLWAHYFDPHTPYDPPERFREDGERPFDHFPIRATLEMLGERDYVQSLYEGEIRYVDESIGNALYTLDQQGLTDDTYIIFSSDHGEEFWDHGGFGHGHTLFNEQLRVPFMITGPDIAQGVVQHPVSGVDVIPTIAELIGEEPYSEWRGESIAGLLKGEKPTGPARPVFAQATGLLPPSPEPLQTVVRWPLKLIRGMETNTYRLYNIQNDPRETRNLAEQRPKQKEELAQLLAEWSLTFPMTFTELKDQGEELTVDQETLENLESIGYID